jgi:hypothetical protein
MKDDELRKILTDKGIIEKTINGDISESYYGFQKCHFEVLCEMVARLKEENQKHEGNEIKLFQSNYKLREELKVLSARFDAVLVHFKLSVQKPADKYSVTQL